MSNWGALFEQQAAAEGETVGTRASVVGSFGVSSQNANTFPPPQNSFGNTSSNRMESDMISKKNSNLAREELVRNAFSQHDYYNNDNIPELLTQKHSESKWGSSRDFRHSKPPKSPALPPVGKAFGVSRGGSFGGSGKSAGGAFGSTQPFANRSNDKNPIEESNGKSAGGSFGVTSGHSFGGSFGVGDVEKRSAPVSHSSSGSTKSVGGMFGSAQKAQCKVAEHQQKRSDEDLNSTRKCFGGAFGNAQKQEVPPRKVVGGAFGASQRPEVEASAKKSVDGGFGSSSVAEKNARGAFGSLGSMSGAFGQPTKYSSSYDTENTPRIHDQLPKRLPHIGTMTAAPIIQFDNMNFQDGYNAPPSRGGMTRGRGGSFSAKSYGTAPRQPNIPLFVPDQNFPGQDTFDNAMPAEEISLLNKYIHAGVPKFDMDKSVVQIQREDPASPLYSSAKSFRELRIKPEIFQALDKMGFEFPTRIQETSLPLLLMEPRHNLIAQAQSGTGKTAAFVITMLCRIDLSVCSPQCICLAPTLELAQQIGAVVESMGQFMPGLKIHYAIKGAERQRGIKLSSHIVIGTPGKLSEYLKTDQRIDASKITCLVLDEADVMITQQGVADKSIEIYTIVEKESPNVQSMLFSATYDDPVIEFASKLVKDAIVVTLKREDQALPNIKQFYVECANRDAKYKAIVDLYSGLTITSSVIFCHTRGSCTWLRDNLVARGHNVAILLGDMMLEERVQTLQAFKDGVFKVLITTNVFARGIDVSQVSVVINYDLPVKYEDGKEVVINGLVQPDYDTYLHRIGRTGRFGKAGIAINFIDSEQGRNMIKIIEEQFSMEIKRIDPSDVEEVEVVSKSL